MENQDRKVFKKLIVVGSMGLEILFLTVGGAWLGKWLDGIWNTKPIVMVTGLFLGMALGFLSFAITMKAFLKE